MNTQKIPFDRVKIGEAFSSNNVFLIKTYENEAVLADFVTYKYFAKDDIVLVLKQG